MTTTQPPANLSKDNAVVSENHTSWKTLKTAVKHADDYAGLSEPGAKHGVIFPSQVWNGGYDVPVWLLYDISRTDEGFTITSYRWNRTEA